MQLFTDDLRAAAALKDGNMQALEYLYNTYHQPVACFLKTYCKDHEQVEEITQDVFLQLWDHRNKINTDLSVKNLLFTIAKHKLIDQVRRMNRQEQVLQRHNYSRQESYNTLDQVILKDYQHAISTVLLQLPARNREIFHLSRNAFLSNAEISRQLNISVKAVEKQITKTLQVLKIFLKSEQILLILATIKIFL
ncbi:RNA polymerase sigma-70 factor [Pedobacter sp. MC2016-14]|uniref:RNA polymerase sigma-70 factor n=1 Tax=Pedobacter sp. MC2016-14 TaxID=2897327 RepID=UPI001E38BB3A|nr:RNA polymerase sigma-70 factor [Pedobacter sp. MC2016-14]MCD0488342.1 RNA polymerase sigma-70 factor [Pedobacter sp. MC2016-14]